MTLREFILAGSSLATGNTIRDHLNNQSVGGSGVDRTFHSPFESSVVQITTSEIVTILESKISSNNLSSTVVNYVESKVTKQ